MIDLTSYELRNVLHSKHCEPVIVQVPSLFYSQLRNVVVFHVWVDAYARVHVFAWFADSAYNTVTLSLL